MPDKINTGELHRLVLELSNTSDVAIKVFFFNLNAQLLLGFFDRV
jgi:hypothetical protein